MRASFVAIPLLLVAVSASAQIFPRRTPEGPTEAPPQNEIPDCVTVRAEGRPDGVGFTHVVVVVNRCRATVRCRISTDADPTPEHPVVLRPGQTQEVVTHLASVAPGVRARAVCRPDGAPPAGER